MGRACSQCESDLGNRRGGGIVGGLRCWSLSQITRPGPPADCLRDPLPDAAVRNPLQVGGDAAGLEYVFRLPAVAAMSCFVLPTLVSMRAWALRLATCTWTHARYRSLDDVFRLDWQTLVQRSDLVLCSHLIQLVRIAHLATRFELERSSVFTALASRGGRASPRRPRRGREPVVPRPRSFPSEPGKCSGLSARRRPRVPPRGRARRGVQTRSSALPRTHRKRVSTLLELLMQPAAVLGQQDVTLACLGNGEMSAGAVTPSRGQQRSAAESPSVGLVVETAPRREQRVSRSSPQRQGGTWERQLFHVGTPSYSGTSAARLRRRILPGKGNSDRCKAATSCRQV